uniref:hypothetical protein n=1 Tax=Herbidospora sakaeratensis TaxID=564415 RepID=UPI0007858DDA|nr:hypothetical protein [Herbidospora sakaeratensis]
MTAGASAHPGRRAPPIPTAAGMGDTQNAATAQTAPSTTIAAPPRRCERCHARAHRLSASSPPTAEGAIFGSTSPSPMSSTPNPTAAARSSGKPCPAAVSVCITMRTAAAA